MLARPTRAIGRSTAREWAQGRLPSEPFWLRPGTKVCAPELLHGELERRCAEPPYNPHARRLWLEELAALRRAVERPIPPPRAYGIDAPAGPDSADSVG